LVVIALGKEDGSDVLRELTAKSAFTFDIPRNVTAIVIVP
jgi:hypothetical protein